MKTNNISHSSSLIYRPISPPPQIKKPCRWRVSCLLYATMSKSITTTTAKELGLSGVKKPLIVVQPTIPIRDALEVMSRNGITSLPMYSHSNTQITSIVNLFDILIHLVKGSETAAFDQEEYAKLAEPLENVLGLDGDMESYRVFKSYDSDDLIDVSLF
jgi:predicted transcriptional regulator